MDDLLTVKTFLYAYEAVIARGRLEANGIECYLKDEVTIGLNPLYSNALGGVKLLVRQQDAELATNILNEHPATDNTLGAGEETFIEQRDYQEKGLKSCPYCGSAEIVIQRRPSGWGFVLSLITLGFPLPFLKKDYHCFNCGKDFKLDRKEL